MKVKLNTVTKVNGVWRQPGQIAELPDEEAKRLIGLSAAVAVSGEEATPQGESDEVAAMRAELERLREIEQKQLAAEAEAKAEAEKEEADRKAAEAKAKKDAADKAKAGAKE